MQQFYRPNGDSTQQRGVLSDVVLPRSATTWKASRRSSRPRLRQSALLTVQPLHHGRSADRQPFARSFSPAAGEVGSEFAKLQTAISNVMLSKRRTASPAAMKKSSSPAWLNSTPTPKTKSGSKSKPTARMKWLNATTTSTKCSRSPSITCKASGNPRRRDTLTYLNGKSGEEQPLRLPCFISLLIRQTA